MPHQRARPLVVVPALNEQDSVGDVIEAVRRAQPKISILVVDDGSTDDTAQRALEKGVSVAQHAVNLGVGGAMRTGFAFALRNGYDTVLQIDGDGQHEPAQLPLLLEALDHADIVVGNRFGPHSKYSAGWSRRLAMRVLSRAVSIHCRTRITDATSGFRASGPRAVPLFARHYPIEYLGDTVESLVLAARVGLTVSEVPVTMRSRAGGRPSQGPLAATMHLARAAFVTLQSFIRGVPRGARDLVGVEK